MVGGRYVRANRTRRRISNDRLDRTGHRFSALPSVSLTRSDGASRHCARLVRLSNPEPCLTESPGIESMPKLDGYLRIKEAAEYLGVSPNTLRNWGRSGKLTERRHPMNRYRLYAKEELDALLNEAETPANKSSRRREPK